MTVVNGFRLVSNSEMQSFKQCRRRWYLGWYLGMAPKLREVQGVRATGTRIHVALAARYVPGKPGTQADLIAALEAEQERDLAAANNRPFGPDEQEIAKLSKDFLLERIMLEGYMEWLAETGEDSNLEVIDSEVYMEAAIPEIETGGVLPPVKAIGKLDTRLRDRRTGRRKFMDHKSVSTFEVPMLHQNQQLLHYELLEFLNLEDADQRCDAALYNMLRRVKRTARANPPFYKRVEVRHNRLEIDSYRQHFIGVVTDMQTVELHLERDRKMLPLVAYPTPHRDCDWKCEFQKVCKMMDDGSRWEALLEDRYEKINPLDYYQGREEAE